jgi:hypothetical protein
MHDVRQAVASRSATATAPTATPARQPHRPALPATRGRPLDPAQLAALQRTAGNAAVGAAIGRPVVQRCGPDHPDCGCDPAERATAQRTVQRDGPAATAPPAEARAVEVKVPQTLPVMLDEWRAAGLLDPPYRPAGVAPIPTLALPPTGAKVPLGGPTAAKLSPGFVPNPQVQPPPVAGPRPVVRPVPPPAGPEPILPPAPVIAIAVFLLILLYPSDTAPAWMDEMNPITGAPYGSPQEYQWIRQLDGPQREYLTQLVRAKKLEPGDGDAESDPLAAPAPDPGTGKAADKDRNRQGCYARQLNGHLGGGPAAAYATRVTGSPNDYFVRTPTGQQLSYDGLTPPATVWECKLGYGWFFNPAKASLRDRKLGEWDLQKDVGVAVAGQCGYVHLWALSDRWVAGLLTTRWGGVPPALHRP